MTDNIDPLVANCVDAINTFFERHNMEERVHMEEHEYHTAMKAEDTRLVKAERELFEDKISPAHYKEIVPGYEYMDMMVHMLDDLKGVEAHLMGQVYKYLMRYGKKDDKTQELKKAQWYLNYLIKHNEEK